MNRNSLSLAIAVAIAGFTSLMSAPAWAQNAEIEALKAQLAAISARLEELEKSQAQAQRTADESQATADRTADVVAQEKSRLSINGDLRYRNESFDVEYVERNRSRDRIRARVNANFRVNDTITGVVGIATGGADPRSANQTLTDQNSRKGFELDLGYVQWAPHADWRVTAGKQRYSWQRSPSMFFDNDVNPEGIAVNYAHGNLFAGVFYDWLAERALSFSNVTSGTNTDSVLYGAQLGYRFPLADGLRLTLAGAYFSFDGVQGYNPLFGGSAFGNTTTTSAAVCSRTLGANVACLLSDYDIVQGFADLTATVGGRPLRVFADYARNTSAEIHPTAGEKLDTAMALGLSYGAVSPTAGTWELGAFYQEVQKDALFGQFVDSNFGDGNTDTNGFVIRGGYALARNWILNGTLFLNDLYNDVPTTVTVFNEATAAPYDTRAISGIQDRDYKRLQLDLNFRF